MGTRFNSLQKNILNAVDGAYSVITAKDEAKKGQITLTGNETEIVEAWFDKSKIHVGKARDNVAKATKTFFVFNTGKTGKLKLVYPKKDKSELRLYMNKTQGFRPKAGDIWFVYEQSKKGPLGIGWMNPDVWANLGAMDEDDAGYLDDLQNPAAPKPTTTTKTGYARKRNVALKRMAAADYKCEVDHSHITFVSPVTDSNFVEPHHLIPMKGQPDFKVSLDIGENIAVLCPNCHKAMHYAGREDKLRLLKDFYARHQPQLSKKGVDIGLDELIVYYNL